MISIIFLFCIITPLLLLLFSFQSRVKESFECIPGNRKKEMDFIQEMAETNGQLEKILTKLNNSPYPFSWNQVLSEESIKNSKVLKFESNIQAYDWSFIKDFILKSLVDNRWSTTECGLHSPISLDPFRSTSLKIFRDYSEIEGYEKDSKYVEIFSKNTENIVLLDTNFKLLDSSESDTIKKTYKDEQVIGNNKDTSYSKIDEEGVSSMENLFDKPLNHRCQRTYQVCQDKVRDGFFI